MYKYIYACIIILITCIIHITLLYCLYKCCLRSKLLLLPSMLVHVHSCYELGILYFSLFCPLLLLGEQSETSSEKQGSAVGVDYRAYSDRPDVQISAGQVQN